MAAIASIFEKTSKEFNKRTSAGEFVYDREMGPVTMDVALTDDILYYIVRMLGTVKPFQLKDGLPPFETRCHMATKHNIHPLDIDLCRSLCYYCGSTLTNGRHKGGIHHDILARDCPERTYDNCRHCMDIVQRAQRANLPRSYINEINTKHSIANCLVGPFLCKLPKLAQYNALLDDHAHGNQVELTEYEERRRRAREEKHGEKVQQRDRDRMNRFNRQEREGRHRPGQNTPIRTSINPKRSWEDTQADGRGGWKFNGTTSSGWSARPQTEGKGGWGYNATAHRCQVRFRYTY